MQLHELQARKGARPKTRIGRGGKRGTTSGRGTKGQKSRAGSRMRPALRDLIMRLPKKRGFRNKPTSDLPVIIDIARLLHRAKSHSEKTPVVIDRDFLKETKLVPMRHQGPIKILGTGEITLPLALRGVKASKRLAESIVKAGGKVE